MQAGLKRLFLCGALLLAVALVAALTRALASDRGARASATCSDYSNQADAERARDTRDADGDGIYCESRTPGAS